MVVQDIASPRFSVVIPAFNSARHIAETVRSVLEQRYPAEEIIVVDDGSTDKTRQVLESVPGAGTVRYHYQPNRGPSGARNRGAALAKGEWIAFLDHDDIWRPDKLLVQAEFARRHPQVALFWCDYEYIDEAGAPRRPLKRSDPLSLLMFNSYISPIPSAAIIRRDAFCKVGGFNAALRGYEDWELFMRLAAEFPIQFIDQVLVRYRCHPIQLSRNVRSWAAHWPPLYKLLSELWSDDPKKQAALRRISAAYHAYFGKHFLRGGEIAEARRHFRTSFEQNPFSWTNLRRWGLSYFPPMRALYCRSKKHAVRV
jgi:glycosyltransferase involved in cell wall biosynthesis